MIVACATTLVAALILVVAPGSARADEAPIAEHGDWEVVNRVLEIPQTCTRDGVVISCEQGSSNTGQVPDTSAGSGGEGSGGTTTASAGAKSNPDDDYKLPELAPDWGSVDDYENQDIDDAPIYVGVPAGAYGLRPPTYTSPYLAPTTTTLTPAWTRPPFGSGPWMIPPSAMMRPAPAPITIVRPPFPLH